MLLLAGLGNPGREYAGQRHNIGFMAVDAIAQAHSFGPWRRGFQGEVAEGRLDGEKVLLLKPLTYMNESGRSLREAMQFYKLDLAEIVVLHDELDLAPGKVRVKTGGGHAGHNGLRSIDLHCGNAYRRVRLGIGHPGDKSRVLGYVLGDFTKDEARWLEPLLDAVARAAPLLAQGLDDAFASQVAMLTAPARPQKGHTKPATPAKGS